jgi:hypothetical protein
MKSQDDLAAGAAMVRRIRVFMILIAVLFAVGVGASFVLFDKPVKILFYLANLKPLSSVLRSTEAAEVQVPSREIEFIQPPVFASVLHLG